MQRVNASVAIPTLSDYKPGDCVTSLQEASLSTWSVIKCVCVHTSLHYAEKNTFPENTIYIQTRCWFNVGWASQKWPNIKPALSECAAYVIVLDTGMGAGDVIIH